MLEYIQSEQENIRHPYILDFTLGQRNVRLCAFDVGVLK